MAKFPPEKSMGLKKVKSKRTGFQKSPNFSVFQVCTEKVESDA